jgi:hypothetical protein
MALHNIDTDSIVWYAVAQLVEALCYKPEGHLYQLVAETSTRNLLGDEWRPRLDADN